MLSPKGRLILAGFLALFLELALIRWLPGNVLSLAYFSNLVLIASFLGLGIGFLLPSRFERAHMFFPLALLALVGSSILLRYVAPVIPDLANEAMWGGLFFGNNLPFPRIPLDIVATLAVVMVLVAGTFLLIGQKISALMKELPPLVAYGYDILGSLLGILAFTLLSFAGGWLSHPVVWFLLSGAIALILIKTSPVLRFINSFAVVALVLLVLVTTQHQIWSPYYRIDTVAADESGTVPVYVNQFFFQQMVDFDKDTLAREKYQLPYLATTPQSVLILGAGSGNDVAMALRQESVLRIDAVEIDPAIAELGKQLHPSRPYDDTRVTLHIDDARSFLQKTDTRYDLIMLGTLDSHALLSARSTVRLDNFVYTQEALQDIKSHLTEDGLAVALFSIPKPWLNEKLVKSMQEVFGEEYTIPFQSSDNYLFSLMVFAGPKVESIIAQNPDAAPASRTVPDYVFSPDDISTDDWPYLYLRDKGVSEYYLGAIIVLVGMALLALFACMRKSIGSLFQWEGGTFFMLGAAFLLLETKSITTFSLLFGSTWIVNALAFASILGAILLANFVATRLRITRVEWLYAMLGVALIAAYAFPLEQLLGLGYELRSGIAALIIGLPLFFASLIFSYTFKEVSDLRLMYGINLMGAVVGGFLEYASMLTGLNALYLIAFALYLGAYACHWFRKNPESSL